MSRALRVTAIRARLLEVPLAREMRAYGASKVNVVWVCVESEDGHVGTGFTYTLGIGSLAVQTMINDVVAPVVRGSEISHWPDTYSRLFSQTRRLGRTVFTPAISAVDIAIWDLYGIIQDAPLWQLIGRQSAEVPIYGSGRSANLLDITELVAGSTSYVDEGYHAIKLRIGSRSPEEDFARVSAVRAASGDAVRLMVDCNEQLDVASAAWFADRLVDLGVYWIEEPFKAENVFAHSALAKKSKIPIAAGEHLVGRHEFEHYIHTRAASVLQPDAALAGGVTGALQAASLAAENAVPVSFHSLPELHINLAVGDSNVIYVEHFPVVTPLLEEELPVIDGHVRPSMRPGHGIKWNQRAVDEYSV